MLLWVLFLIPTVLATELRIGSYVLKVEVDTLRSIDRVSEDSSEELNLSGLGLSGIADKNVFDNLEHVRRLDLSNNSLSQLPEFVFSNLTNLERLSLADNRIEEFENAFVGLHNLKSLNISRNPMKHLRKSFLFGLTKSSEVVTSGNEFWSMSTELFENPFLRTHEETLAELLREEAESKGMERRGTVEANEKKSRREAPVLDKELRAKVCLEEGGVLGSLEVMKKDEKLASDCKEIEIDHQSGSLHVSDLAISKFKTGWYRLPADLPRLGLSLDRNNIVRVERELLNELPENVGYVNLAENMIERLEKGVIENKHLKNINFRANSIATIEDGAFEKTNLTALYLADNRLKDTRFVASLPTSVTQIVLLKNEIAEVTTGSFSKLNHLLYLNLDGNRLAELKSESLRGLSSLQALNLNRCRLERIEPNSFQDLSSLTVLDLSNNQVTSLEKGVFNGLSSIERIYMGGNRITKIGKEALHGLSDTLLELGLNSNKLESLEAGTFVNTPKQLLMLQANRISKIEKGTFDVPKLHDLRLEDNSLRTLDGDSFEGLPQLRHLSVKANGIARIEKGAAKNLGSLYDLDISDNPIERLENGALFGLQKSHGNHLRLTGVPLRVIQGGLFDDV